MGKLTKIWLKEISKSTVTNKHFLSDKFDCPLDYRWISLVDINDK